jgi:hypothetical protein
VPVDTTARRAFWLNVYNLLSMHALRARRSRSALDVMEALRTVYWVAGHPLSIHTIEHAMLRNNAPAPRTLTRPLRARDPRMVSAVALDPRIHFALNCGATSCPAVRVYRADSLDAQLAVAERAFIEAETHVDEVAHTVLTSRIFAWYERDFGGRAGVLALIARVLGADVTRLMTMHLAYRRYDWSAPA